MPVELHPAGRKYQVFVSSTFNDLKAERQVLSQALLKAGDFIPAGMELFTASSTPPWDVIRRALEDSDYLVLILGNRYGSLAPGGAMSYTEMEYNYAIGHDIPVLAFLSSDTVPLAPSHREN